MIAVPAAEDRRPRLTAKNRAATPGLDRYPNQQRASLRRQGFQP